MYHCRLNYKFITDLKFAHKKAPDSIESSAFS